MAHKVFICHSSIDKLVADAACAALEAQRIPCWIAPRDVLPGMEYGKAIIQALSDCEIVLLIFSSHANHSGQVRREIERAVSKEKIILPFRIENVLPSDAMEFALGNTHWLDALTPPLESYLVKLCETVTRLLQQQNQTPLWQTPRPNSEEIQPLPEPQEGVAKPEPVSAPRAAKTVSVPERFPEPSHAAPEPVPVPGEVAVEAASIPTPTGEWPGSISGPISDEPAGERPAEEKTAFEVKTTPIWLKQTWVKILVPLVVILLAVAFMIWSRTPSPQKSAAEDQRSNAMTSPSNLPSVDLAKVENPVAMPDADKEDAVVVTITRDGNLFLGQDRVAASDLGPRVRDKLIDKVNKTVFVRADFRAQYRGVEDAIDSMRRVGADAVGLLTLKKGDVVQESYSAGGKTSLKSIGLEVLLPGPFMPSPRNLGDRTIVVQVIYRSDTTPAYKINLADVAQAELHSRLTDIYVNRAQRVMFVRGDDNLDFSYIADVVDIGMASGVDKIGLMTPGTIAGN
jgi:biopolymer transport protein ExbD